MGLDQLLSTEGACSDTAFDIVSGGAGFATSARHAIESLLKKQKRFSVVSDMADKYCHHVY